MKPSVNAVSVKSKHQQLPIKLHQLLTAAEEEDFTNIISWSSDGRSFRVHDKQRFVDELMPSYFNSNIYKTFQRSLNLWQFRSLPDGKNKGAIYNENFVRGMPDLCDKMMRIRVKCKNARSHLKSKKAAAQASQAAPLSWPASTMVYQHEHIHTHTNASPALLHCADPQQTNASSTVSSLSIAHDAEPAAAIPAPVYDPSASSLDPQQQLLLTLLGAVAASSSQEQEPQSFPEVQQAWPSPPSPSIPIVSAFVTNNDNGQSGNTGGLTLQLLTIMQQLLPLINQAPEPITVQNEPLGMVLLRSLVPLLLNNIVAAAEPQVPAIESPPSSSPDITVSQLQALLATSVQNTGL